MLKLQPQPEQELAIHTIDRNVAVSAGAGSGKTRVLVERFVNILEQEENVDATAILAITFTRKAAAEMKNRVRQLLSQRAEDNPADAFWRAQLQALERTQISTIHSLCSRILRENPVEAQLDPQFVVAEEFEAADFISANIAQYIRQQIRNKNAAMLLLIDAYGTASVERQLLSLVPQLSELAKQDLCAPYRNVEEKLQRTVGELMLALRQLVQDREVLTSKNSKGRQKLDELAENITTISAALNCNPPRTQTLEAGMAGLSAAGKIKELVNEVKSKKEQLDLLAADAVAQPLAQAWQKVLRDVAGQLLQQKIEHDLLTFDDLEELVLRLLEQNESVRKKYQQRFRYIMVDEFQDTNDRQRQLIYLLCGDAKDELQGQKLFVVGDPKQSIYRFRGADVSVFARVRREIEQSGGILITLNKNFRSVNKVLEACNAAFRVLLGEDSSKDVFFEALEHHKESEVIPSLLEIVYDKDADAGITKRELEALALAQKINALHAEEGVTYGGMAILVRAMTHVDEVADALQNAGIPYTIIDGKGFYERQEVLDLLHLLTALHNRHRSLELAGVLRSPYFGLDDATLTRLFLVQAPCLWDALQQADYSSLGGEQEQLARRAAVILDELRQLTALSALPEVWNALWEKLHVEAVLGQQEHGRAALANAKKLRSLAQSYCVDKQATLGDWLDYVAKLRAAEARETAANIVDNPDVVSIMTIHKSKGLEFKTVFLPMLDAGTQGDKEAIRYLPQLGLGFNVLLEDKFVPTSVLKEIKEENKLLEQAERVRQLYVAMTRAEERLILSGVTDGKGKRDAKKTLHESSWMAQLQEIFAGDAVVELDRWEQQDILDHALYGSLSGQQPYAEEELALAAPLPAYEENGGAVFTPSALQLYLHCQRAYYYRHTMGLPALEEEHASEAGTHQLPANVIGNLVHRALEVYHGDAEAAFSRALQDYAVQQDASYAKKLFLHYLDSDLYKNLPGKKRREFQFMLPLEYNKKSIYLKGIIDCLGEEDGRAVLVDYKTGAPPQPGEVKKGYAYQLAIYREAVRRLLHKEVSSAQLHFLRNLTTWTMEDADKYLDEALALCLEITEKNREEEFLCQAEMTACAYCPYAYLCKKI